MTRWIKYTFSASAPPVDPDDNNGTWYQTNGEVGEPIPYPVGGGYFKARAWEGGESSGVTSKSFERGVVLDYWKYYQFNGNSNDANGVETAQLNGITSYVTGKELQALQTVAGGSNYARITMPTGDYSVSLWQFLSGAGTGQPLSIASSTGSGAPNFFFNITANNGTTASYNTYMNGNYTTTKTGYNVTQWNHIVISKTGTVQKMYLNGSLGYTANNSYDQTYLYLGNAFSTYSNIKSFDLVRVYQRALSDSEVTEIYNSEI